MQKKKNLAKQNPSRKNKQNITPCKKKTKRRKTKQNPMQKNTKPIARTNTCEKHTKTLQKKQQTKYTLQHRNTKPIAKKKKQSPWQKKKLLKKHKIHEKKATLCSKQI